MSHLRLTAMKALMKVTDEGGYIQLVLSKLMENSDLSGQDKALLSGICYAAMVHLQPIDRLIDAYSKVPCSKLKKEVRAALRIGICQLVYLDGIKPYAAVSETVSALKKTKGASLSGYANGVLRHLLRDLEASADREQLGGVCLHEILPSWIREKLTEAYGAERSAWLESIFETRKPVCIRLDAENEEEKKALLEALQEKTALRAGRICPDAFYLSHAQGITEWPAFLSGRLYIQDESSMTACQALLTLLKRASYDQPIRIADLCGAPGGKAGMIAGRLGKGGIPSGMVYCRDLYAHRVELIRENARRLQLENLVGEVKDASVAYPEDREAFEAVLLDAPCSGLGVVRTKPDILYFRKPEDIPELAALQQKMLDAAALAVKKGGYLLYSTCTLLPEENQEQVLAFLQRHPEFAQEDLLAYLPEDCGLFQRHLTLLPEENGHEGFFISVFRKHE